MALIDLRSDTLTLPTAEMLQSMVTAKLGDDSRDGDPTVRELEAESARLLGKEAAIFTVSGTMSNTLALRTHANPGAAAIVEESAHVYGMEWSGVAAACGLLVIPVVGHCGAPDPDRVRWAGKKAATMYPERGVLCLENTHNAAGGTVMTAAQIDELAAIGRTCGLSVHLDGARIFNAAVALGVKARELVRSVDTVSFCLSKGLSAPVGSVLVGSKAFIERAGKVRRSFGAAIRQAGDCRAGAGRLAQHDRPACRGSRQRARVRRRRGAGSEPARRSARRAEQHRERGREGTWNRRRDVCDPPARARGEGAARDGIGGSFRHLPRHHEAGYRACD